ncbi:MAG: thioredoxin family protein [Ferruginibacter sp.]
MTFPLLAQTGYEVSWDLPNHPTVKILKGIINQEVMQKDTSFQWFAANQKSYQPDTAYIQALKKIKNNKMQLIVFGGTWCEDTQFILPRFFKLAELAEITSDKISLLGVDRAKQTLGNLSAAMGITNVPTIIVLKNGKELGRVVEYGKTGQWDKELAELILINE